jgi:hypothetical protein
MTNNYDTYRLEHETWRVLDNAEQCKGCEAMSYIFSNKFGEGYCIGCSDRIAQVLHGL